MDAERPVYIARMAKLTAPEVPSGMVADLICQGMGLPDHVREHVAEITERVGLKSRYLARDFSKSPEKELISQNHSSLEWCHELLQSLMVELDPPDIGGLHLTYNGSSHENVLPNLASQLCLRAGLHPDMPPEEMPYLGCAGAIYSLQSAVRTCRSTGRPVVVIAFDQCSWLSKPNQLGAVAMSDSALIPYLLFNDGAVGFLLVPDNWTHKFTGPLARIESIRLGYQPGDAIEMVDGHFMNHKKLRDIMPPLVGEKLILPLLKAEGLQSADIEQWAFHQGGPAIMKRIAADSSLGLTSEQLSASWKSFYKYGNMSCVSGPMVLHEFFTNGPHHTDKTGMLVGFGAGYYFGAMLYRWAVA